MNKIIKTILSIILVYIGGAFIKWDFYWFLSLANIPEHIRFLAGVLILLLIILFYIILSFIESEL